MDPFEECEVKYNKRIKLEHSYAKDDFIGGEEDPLKIHPADLDSIKKETEDEETIIIKTEPSDEYSNEASQDGSWHTEEALMEVVASEPCASTESNFFISNVVTVPSEAGLEKNADAKYVPDTVQSTNTDTVPKHVFQELQKMYEKTVADMRALNKKMSADAKKKKGSQSSRSDNVRILKNDVKKLKDELKESKSKEQFLKRMLDLRSRDEASIKKNSAALKSQMEELLQLNKNNALCITDLKSQVQMRENTIRSMKLAQKQQNKNLLDKKKELEEDMKKWKQSRTQKEAERKELQAKCKTLTQKFEAAHVKNALQQNELEKLKLDMDIMDKSIIDSMKTRQLLKDQVVQIEKDLEGLKDNPALNMKLQEMCRALEKSKSQKEDLQRMLRDEQKISATLMNERDQLRKENSKSVKEAERQVGLMKQTVAALKRSLSQKIDRARIAEEECQKLREELELRREEFRRKENEFREREKKLESKQCEYCGF